MSENTDEAVGCFSIPKTVFKWIVIIFVVGILLLAFFDGLFLALF